MEKTISNHVVEIRYKPNSRFLDEKGHIAAQLAVGKFNHWGITNNRIDFSSSLNPELSAFFSFRNLGLTTLTPMKAQDFLKEAEEYIKSCWQYFEVNNIVRIGVRSSYLVETHEFNKIFDAYKKNFLKIGDCEIKNFSGEFVDLAFSLNFIDGDNFINFTTGPMEKKQGEEIFGEAAFKSGVYIEIDYFRKEFSTHITQKDVITFISDGIKRATQIAEKINEGVNP